MSETSIAALESSEDRAIRLYLEEGVIAERKFVESLPASFRAGDPAERLRTKLAAIAAEDRPGR